MLNILSFKYIPTVLAMKSLRDFRDELWEGEHRVHQCLHPPVKS